MSTPITLYSLASAGSHFYFIYYHHTVLIGFFLWTELDIGHVMEEAKSRWLRPNEIHAILCNHKYFTIYVKPINLPPGIILYVSMYILSLCHLFVNTVLLLLNKYEANVFTKGCACIEGTYATAHNSWVGLSIFETSTCLTSPSCEAVWPFANLKGYLLVISFKKY